MAKRKDYAATGSKWVWILTLLALLILAVGWVVHAQGL